MLGSVRDAAGGAWSVLLLDPTTTKVRGVPSCEAAHQQGRPASCPAAGYAGPAARCS